jgi:hypothetical protein
MDVAKTLTIEDIQRTVPSRKGTVTQEAVDLINASMNEPEFQGEPLLQSLGTYESVMVKNKVGITDFVNALRFCAYLLSQDDNYTEAYKKTFYNREFVKNRMNVEPGSKEYRELTSAASRYRNSKVVVDILTIADVPLYLMFQGARWKAVGVLANEMETAAYSRDRINAADKLLQHVKPPENIQIEMDIGVKENSAVQQLNDQLAELAKSQKTHLESGSATLEDFGSMKVRDDSIIDAEIENG